VTDVNRRIFFRALPRGVWRTRTAHRASRGVGLSVVLILACLLAGPVPGRCAEAPAVTGIAVRQAGAFVAASPQEAAATGRRHRLSQEGAAIAPGPGTAFGVIFEVQGTPAATPVVIEAGLVPPGNDPVPQRWFVPAVIGEKGQAVASFVYAWEAAPGPWRLTLAEGGRVLAEQTFHVGGPPQAPVAPLVAPPAAPTSLSTSSPVAPPAPVPTPAPTSAQTPAPASEIPGASVPPASPAVAPPAAPEHPVAAGQSVASGQPATPATPSPPLPAPGAAPEGHAPPAAVIPGPASPAVAGVAPEAAVPAETPRTPEKGPEKAPAKPPEKAPEKAPEKNPDTGKKAPSPEPGVKAPEKAPAKEAATANGTLYLLQTGIFSVKDNAFSQAARYRAKGYPGCVLEEGAGSKRRYRVIVGRFPDQDRAMEARRAFASREGGEVMVKEFPAAEVARRLKCR